MPLSRYAPGIRRHLLTGWLVVFTALTFFSLYAIASVGRDARHNLCVELEKLKTQNRADALRDFAQLNRTLKLLHLKRTPELVAAAKEGRDRKLARNQRKEC